MARLTNSSSRQNQNMQRYKDAAELGKRVANIPKRNEYSNLQNPAGTINWKLPVGINLKIDILWIIASAIWGFSWVIALICEAYGTSRTFTLPFLIICMLLALAIFACCTLIEFKRGKETHGEKPPAA